MMNPGLEPCRLERISDQPGSRTTCRSALDDAADPFGTEHTVQTHELSYTPLAVQDRLIVVRLDGAWQKILCQRVIAEMWLETE
jgi:hypothetical protein